jgi:hypothetical protein
VYEQMVAYQRLLPQVHATDDRSLGRQVAFHAGKALLGLNPWLIADGKRVRFVRC